MGQLSQGSSKKPGAARKSGTAKKRVYPKLIVCTGDDQHVVELSQKITSMGRSHDNTIEIDDINSSRHHCQIERADGAYEIVDLKSRNGTLVNGILVLRKELRAGDCIEIGKTRMFYEHISREFSDETIDLTTDYFLEPLSGLEEEGQLDVLKKEREIFLKLLEAEDVGRCLVVGLRSKPYSATTYFLDQNSGLRHFTDSVA